MNDDAFEQKLRELSGRLIRPSPTADWKAGILSLARQARDRPPLRSSRGMLAVLGAAWLLIAVLRFTTPADTHVLRTDPTPIALTQQRHTSLQRLLAYHAHPELLDLP